MSPALQVPLGFVAGVVLYRLLLRDRIERRRLRRHYRRRRQLYERRRNAR